MYVSVSKSDTGIHVHTTQIIRKYSLRSVTKLVEGRYNVLGDCG